MRSERSAGGNGSERTLGLLCAVAAAVTFVVGNVQACPVCFGDAQSTVTDGLNAAMALLLGVTGGVIGLLASVALRIRRRLRAPADEPASSRFSG